MLEPKEVLAYLSDVAGQSDTEFEGFCNETQIWSIPFDAVRSGGFSSHMTREIMLAHSLRYHDVAFGEESVPILICIKSLVSGDGNRRVPLLNIRATLDPNGTLRPYATNEIWIPRKSIASNEYESSPISVCDLDAYRAHQEALSSLPYDSTWGSFVNRATDFFDAVNSLDEQALSRESLSLDETTCAACLWEGPCESVAIAQVLSDARLGENNESEHDGPGLLGAMLEDGRQPEPIEENLSDDVLLSYKLNCGLPDFMSELSQRDREAIAAFARQQENGVLTVTAPLGTNRDAFAISAMANLVTECALRGTPAPFMLCVASSKSVECILNKASKRVSGGQVALSSRWLPRVSVTPANGDTLTADKKALGSLPAIFSVYTADGARPEQCTAALERTYAHARGGSAAYYSESWYIPKATMHFLDCSSSFLEERMHELREARISLSDTLRRIDQERCDLIDAYADVCKASELLRQRDDLVARIGRLRRGHKICRDRLRHWEALDRTSQPAISLLGPANTDQTAIIRRNAQQGEELAANKETIADVCSAYRNEIARIESSIDRMRGAAANLTRRVKSAAPAGKKCREIIAKLASLCRLSAKQSALLEAAIDGRGGEVSLQQLDIALDNIVRPAEFWLSMHINEAQWLIYCQRRLEGARSRGKSYDSRMPFDTLYALCPFNLVDQSVAVGMISKLMEKSDPSKLVTFVLDADTMDIAQGMALSALSGRLVVLGSQSSLGASPRRGETFDELRATARMGGESWGELRSAGMAASQRMSLYSYALSRKGGIFQRTFLQDTFGVYGELNDLRMDLYPDERLKTHRIPANSADDTHYALGSIIPSLSYVLVPDSAWEQYGSSKQNRSEAMALGRWLSNHVEEILERYREWNVPAVVIATPFVAQANVLKAIVEAVCGPKAEHIAVRTIADLQPQRWPLVILSTTCGPEAYTSIGLQGSRPSISLACAAAQDALIVFCGGAWVKSQDAVAAALFKHARRVGRLFSSPRKRTARPVEGDGNSKANLNLRLRSKPQSMSTLIKTLEARGQISGTFTAAEVNRALEEVGLIERCKDASGKSYWRPTAAGREVGIVPTKDRAGHSFCSYTKDAEAVVATTIASLSQE